MNDTKAKTTNPDAPTPIPGLGEKKLPAEP
jgi:hypothetical protein